MLRPFILISVLMGLLELPLSFAAPLACEEGLRNFPFLKPWVAKLSNFVAPVDTGIDGGGPFFALGFTIAGENAVEAWRTDRTTLGVDWKAKNGKIESAWLGESTLVSPTAETHWAKFWGLLFAPGELELLSECSKFNCKIKFNDPELRKVIERLGTQNATVGRSFVKDLSHEYRLNLYRDIVKQRMEAWEQKGELRSYEGTAQGLKWEDLRISPSFPAKYDTHFWRPKDRGSYGYEFLDAEPGRHKPVVGVFSRQCERRGHKAQSFTICTDIIIYNNHYFDFWARQFLFFPWCGKQAVLAYETMDVDQAKGNRVVRILFGSDIRRLIGLLLETRLKRLHMLGF